MKSKLFIMFAAVILMAACTNEETFDSTPEQTAKQALGDIRSYDEALQIAQNSISLLNNGEDTRASSTRKINLADSKAVLRDATTRSSDGGNDTLMYVFNFEDNQGFVIVSASRRTEDLLAVTEKGNYDPEVGSEVENFNYFMEKAKEYVTKEPKLRFPPDIPVLYERDSIVSEVQRVGPYVTVLWGQTHPEGQSCPNGVAGCTNTALAQIMSYFEYPSSVYLTYNDLDSVEQVLNWTQMKEHPATLHPISLCPYPEAHGAIANFVRQLGVLTNSSYETNPNRTGTEPGYARIALNMLGYHHSSFYIYDYNTACDSLDNQKLVLMGGGSDVNTGGHAWVFDGYMKIKTYIYHLERVSANSNEWIIVGVDITRQNLCHYNWGWYGNCNGYFASNVFDTSAGTIYEGNHTINNNYSENPMVIYVCL